MKGIIVFIVAVIIGIVLLPLGVIYGIFDAFYHRKFRTAWKRLTHYFWSGAIAIDQLGNALCSELFNDTLIRPSGAKFGNPDETISSCIGRNKRAGTLTWLGKALDWILDKMDENHSIKSIEK